MSASSCGFFASHQQPFDLQAKIIAALSDGVITISTPYKLFLALMEGEWISESDKSFALHYAQELVQAVEQGSKNVDIFLKVRGDIQANKFSSLYAMVLLAMVLCEFVGMDKIVEADIQRIVVASAGKLGGSAAYLNTHLRYNHAMRYLNAYKVNADGNLELDTLNPHEFGDRELSVIRISTPAPADAASASTSAAAAEAARPAP